VKREHTRIIRLFLDEWLPPILREQRWLYRWVLGAIVKGDVESYLNFRQNAWRMTDEDLQNFYRNIKSNIDRPTDCNERTVERILRELATRKPESILEFGCGRGHVAKKMIEAVSASYTGVDFDTRKAKAILPENVRLLDGVDLEVLEPGETFDCVVCTHTIEHVRDIRRTITSLIDRTQGFMIIVVPLQLNLRYSADLHTRFWRSPGEFFLDAGIRPDMNPVWYEDLGDLFVALEPRGYGNQ
jgi:SAM-dependent methyltransferase